MTSKSKFSEKSLEDKISDMIDLYRRVETLASELIKTEKYKDNTELKNTLESVEDILKEPEALLRETFKTLGEDRVVEIFSDYQIALVTLEGWEQSL